MGQRPPEGLGSRDRILWAATTMLGEGPGAILSVRAVAARAEVSAGSLRHHFPTQRELMDAALGVVYEVLLPGDSMHDRSLTARERLVACLQRLLAPGGEEVDSREAWRRAFESYVANEPTQAARNEFLAIDREIRRRIDYCLRVLQGEGTVPAGDNSARVELLLNVVNGLSIARAMPTEVPRAQAELDTLRLAAGSVIVDEAHGGGLSEGE
ncbi:MAG TPA: TetR/AcrR family transcriptional regulator [Dietzia timorensis]|uniref:TetR/AcrR family transcriptional regulator n=1 Tax=Dietzia timorensis TaxID=499555 RepID=A0A921F1Q0_9ACTN|nr:TetR/AcrR family transcriptional regulator [Dietzia timorensis]HJE89700.1 TetR/AcrR family transcriptional regulator [Dietzia timorensis]